MNKKNKKKKSLITLSRLKEFYEKLLQIDKPLRNKFIQLYLSSVSLFVFSIIFSIFIRSTLFFIYVLFIVLLIWGITTYRCLKCFENKVGIYEGICVEISEKKKLFEFFKREYYTLKIDQVLPVKQTYYLTVVGSRKAHLQIGNFVRLYCLPQAIYKQNEDSYVVYSIYFSYILKRCVDDVDS